MITPKPASLGQKTNPKKENKGYQASEMAAKKSKEERDRKNEIDRWETDLVSEQANLEAQEKAYAKERQDIERYKREQVRVTNANSGTSLDIKNIERQSATKIEEIKSKLAALDQDTVKLERDTQNKNQLLAVELKEREALSRQSVQDESERKRALAEKEQEEKAEAQRIAQIEEEIKQKNLELQKVEKEHDDVQKEIAQMKAKVGSKQVTGTSQDSELRRQIEESQKKVIEKKDQKQKLTSELAALEQGLNTKKQEAEKANQALFAKNKEAELHERSVKESTEKAQLIVRRIEESQRRIADLKNRIKAKQK